jgi:hypothetical protein
MGPDDDGWEEVTDPAELKAVGGASAVKRMQEARARAPGLSGSPADAVGGTLETAPARDKARGVLLTIQRLQPAIDDVRRLQRSALGAKGLAGLAEYNPFSSSNQEYDAAVAALTALVRPATRQAGEGAMSDFESKLAVATLPSRWRRDSYNDRAMHDLQRLVDTSRDLYGRQLGLAAPAPRALPAPPPAARSRPGGAQALKRKYGLR